MIQDMPDKKGNLFAAVSGKLTLNTGDIKLDKKGNAVLDEAGDMIPILDDINFIFSLNKYPDFKTQIQAMAVEALTLKNMQIAEENGQLSHFVEAVGAVGTSKKKGPKDTKKIKRKKK